MRALQQFEWSVRALAQEPAVQLGLYPSYVAVADELALEFEEHYRAIDVDSLRATARVALEALDNALDEMSGADHAELWQAEALERPEWRQVRVLARALIAAMGWSATAPPVERGAIYAGSDA